MLKFDLTIRSYEIYNEDFGSRYRCIFVDETKIRMLPPSWLDPVFEDCSFANGKVTITVSIFTLQQRKIWLAKRSNQTKFVNSIIYFFRILREYANSDGGRNKRWRIRWRSQGFARSLYLKSYLGQGNGAISFNLKEERGNQQPKQQKHGAGFLEHGYFFNFTDKFNVIWYLRKPVMTELRA